jgi:acyl carrier protein
MVDSAATAITSIREWIAEKNPNVGFVDLDIDLIETRTIDSLQFAEFVFLLEEITGRPIDLADVNLDAFRSLRSITAHFLARLDPP